ncbi:hypothetical protein [Massilia orientalis]|uniref:Uncharacterized protein n=1 Tax=Massilia orientalis TaxID=3050128 RepID=A0ACC7M4N1_9BURK|nr:hypothetical protein [Massilia sp. YIM B02787]
MNDIGPVLALSIAATCCLPASARQLDVARFLKERGAESAELRQLARSPSPAVVPVAFYDKDGMAPSCGLLVAVPHAAKPRYIDILDADSGSTFPQCVAIPSIRAFRLQDRRYLAIEYLDRDTRDDTYRYFHYVYDDPAQGFVEDKMLNDGVPSSDLRKQADGIKLARETMMRKTFPQWRFLERDFIAGDTSSFATFEDGHARACHFAMEAGTKPLSANLADVASTTGCASVLAATRLDAPAATYYISMFRSDAGKQLVAIASIANDGTLKVEKDLSADINGAGATGDIRAARTALSQRLGTFSDPSTRQ